MAQYIVSARKYRPDSFGTLIGQDNIAVTLKNSILRGQLAHAYLFCGPRGVGKTTTARIFAKMINCSNPSADMEPCGTCESCQSFAEGRSYCIHELDAASNNGVEDMELDSWVFAAFQNRDAETGRPKGTPSSYPAILYTPYLQSY